MKFIFKCDNYSVQSKEYTSMCIVHPILFLQCPFTLIQSSDKNACKYLTNIGCVALEM